LQCGVKKRQTKASFLNLFKNRSYCTFLAVFIFVQTCINLLLALLVFYVDLVVQKYAYYSLFMGVLLVVQMCLMGIYGKVAEKKGKRFPLFFGMPFFILAMASLLFLTPDTPIPVICIICAVVPLGTAAANVVGWSMLSDLYDVGELITGKRNEGLYSGFSTFIYKVSSGVAILLIGFGLAAVGFNQDQYNYLKGLGKTAEALAAYNGSAIVWTIKGMLAGIPSLFMLVSLIFLARYKLNEKRFGLVRRALAAFRASTDSGVDRERIIGSFSGDEQKDLEMVTGHKVSTLWT
jgi:oligogalacturonide transporter